MIMQSKVMTSLASTHDRNRSFEQIDLQMFYGEINECQSQVLWFDCLKGQSTHLVIYLIDLFDEGCQGLRWRLLLMMVINEVTCKGLVESIALRSNAIIMGV